MFDNFHVVGSRANVLDLTTSPLGLDERGNILPEVPLLAKPFAQRDLAHALRQVLRSIETN